MAGFTIQDASLPSILEWISLLKNVKRMWAKVQGFCDDFRLAPVVFVDKNCGGRSDAKSLFGFGGFLIIIITIAMTFISRLY